MRGGPQNTIEAQICDTFYAALGLHVEGTNICRSDGAILSKRTLLGMPSVSKICRAYYREWEIARSQAEHKNRKTLYKALKAAVDAVRDADPAIFDTCNKLPNACSSGDEQAIIWALGVKETALAASEMLAEAVKPDELPPRRRGRQRNETYYAVAHEVALLFFEIMKMPPTYGFDNQKQDLVPKTEYSRALYEVCKVLNMTNFGSLKNAAKHTVDEFKSRPLNASAA